MSSKTAAPSDMGKPGYVNKAAKAYLRQVGRKLSCVRAQGADFLRQLEDEVFLYCEDHEEMEMAGLTAHFGTPEEVANNFLTELAPAVRWKYERNKRRVLYAAVGIFLITIFLIFAMKLHTYVKQQDIVNGYYVETITYIQGSNPIRRLFTRWLQVMAADGNTMQGKTLGKMFQIPYNR